MPRTIIVIPCYNEAHRLDGARFLAVVDGDPRLDLLFVNDGSRDGTLERIRDLASKRPGRITWCDLPVNEGKAEAVRRGMQVAFRRHPEYVGFWDADLATPLDEIGRFRAVLDRRSELQLVIGSRTRLLGRRIERKRSRTLLGRLFATVASRAVQLPVFDTQCGAKLFRVNAESERLFAEPFLSRWIFDVELFARLVSDRRRNGRRPARESLYELPLDEWRDVAGSKLRSSDFLKAIGELAAIRWRYFHTREPSPRFAPRASRPALELPAEWRADRKAA